LRLPISLPLNTQAQSATGIGRSAALLFAREGAKALYLSDLPRQEAGLKALEKLIGEKYPDVKVTLVPGDAADEASVKGICDRAIKEHGQLDVFFANAAMIGQSSYVSMENLAAADFDKMMHVNVVSCVPPPSLPKKLIHDGKVLPGDQVRRPGDAGHFGRQALLARQHRPDGLRGGHQVRSGTSGLFVGLYADILASFHPIEGRAKRVSSR
jgi:NAD(P)-dependent dehydrogenase (short-subunit alcohol dehydrogenase family)